ncbi:MAG: serine/threonine protein kinase [Polyangiaceae bacterium]|nr:serine/threonine protein kinase [Polyangiaceae bacterium]
MALREGDLFDGRYRIQRLLGRGGMGEVWAAVAPPGNRRVALKVLLDKAARKPDLVARFEREARIAERIKSPFVCELVDSGKNAEGELYIAFELLQGESLADRLRRETDLPFSEVGPVIEDVLSGLVDAHGVGVIHRDLKPGNIFLEKFPDNTERAKVLDFGVSKVVRPAFGDERSLTAFDATLGSFAYMAPEQVRGAARADERADLYAVGAVAFRALAGRLPFEGTTASMLLAAKLDQEAPSLSVATGVQWPGGIERFLAKALARDRKARFANVAEALAAWRELAVDHNRALAAGNASVQGLLDDTNSMFPRSTNWDLAALLPPSSGPPSSRPVLPPLPDPPQSDRDPRPPKG